MTATNSIGTRSATSNLTGTVLSTLPANTAVPLLAGSTTVGRTLQASTGSWTGIGDTFSYRWGLCNAQGSNCVSITGATGPSYSLTQADLGSAVHVTVTATNQYGSAAASSAGSVVTAMLVQTASFNAVLRTNQEVTRPTRTSGRAAGHFTAKLVGKTLTWTLSFSALSGRPTVVTLNRGARGANGVAFKSLCRECASPLRGSLTLTASQLDALMLGATYVNIHTARNTAGEIRGQVNRLG